MLLIICIAQSFWLTSKKNQFITIKKKMFDINEKKLSLRLWHEYTYPQKNCNYKLLFLATGHEIYVLYVIFSCYIFYDCSFH